MQSTCEWGEQQSEELQKKRIFIITSCNVAVIGEFINKKAASRECPCTENRKQKQQTALINSQTSSSRLEIYSKQ
jgi:hypothetical protein